MAAGSNPKVLYLVVVRLLLLVWHAPLGVRSAKRRHQSPEWTILSHSYHLIQGEIVRSQVLLDSLHPCSSRTSWWFPPVLRRVADDTPGICLVWHIAMWLNRERRRAWTIADRRGCPVVRLTSSFGDASRCVTLPNIVAFATTDGAKRLKKIWASWAPSPLD